MDVKNVVAHNVKALRENRKLTLEAASEATGVSRSMLAQIEKGDVNPTISVLWKIANGFKVSFTSLIEVPGEAVTLLRREEVVPLAEDGGKYLNYPAFVFDESKLFESYRIVIKPEGALSAQPHLAGTEEYITVFAGEVEIRVEAESYCLRRGDSIRFRADVAHGYRNTGESDAELSMLIYYNR
jgi:Predicted transcriptional regulators